MTQFPPLDPSRRLTLLSPPVDRVRAIIDTDTYNEIDDQFAVVHALLSPEKLRIDAILAAPFFNSRSTGPADGMEKSYEEILRLLERLGRDESGRVFRGSDRYLTDAQTPVQSEAALRIVNLAGDRSPGPLYILAIGAATNVASALLLSPEIIENIVVVWLGGNALYWPTASEFNLKQDLHASRLLFDSGVALVHIPCKPVASHLHTMIPEIERYVEGRGPIGDYLARITRDHTADSFAWSKVIWDISTVAWVLDPRWVPTVIEHSPILTDQLTWSRDPSRHMIRTAVGVDRDAIFRDFFTKIANNA